MGILVIQNKYNEEHSNAVVTHTYGNYNDAINAIKKFASKFFAVYNEGVDKDFDVKHRASQRDDINYFHAVCYTVADGVYEGDTRTQAFLQSISKSAKEFDTNPATFIKRWEPYPHIVINFRANYMKVNADNLHDQDAFFHKLNEALTFGYHTQCNVCNTDVFYSEIGQQINYHKGIFTTSILDEENNTLEVNDFVINMFGELYIDWIFEEQYAPTDDMVRSIDERY